MTTGETERKGYKVAITFEQLRVFRTVVLHGRVSLAAAALGVSQPSISQQLRRLEEALGFALLESREGRLVPTEHGERVREIADHVAAGADRLRELSAAARLGTHSVLIVGANTTGGMYFVPELIRRFQREHPGVGVRLLIGQVNELTAAVAGGVCDVAIVGGPITAREFATVALFTDRLPLIVSPSDPFASRRQVQVNDLKTRQFVLPGIGSRTRLVVETALRRVGVELDRVLEYPDTESVKKAVEAGLGIGYLSREGVRRELLHGYLAEVLVEGLAIERPFQAFWLKDRKIPALVPMLVETARQLVASRETTERTQTSTSARAGHGVSVKFA